MLDWRWRTLWTSTCPSDHKACWWAGDDLGTHEGRMDMHLYNFIFESFYWSTIHNYNQEPSRLVFQHDNDPKHTSKIEIVHEWLASQLFQLLKWHAQSLNLNPIEHFWALLKWCLNKFTTPRREKQKRKTCSHLATIDQAGQKNHNGKRIGDFFCIIFYYIK